MKLTITRDDGAVYKDGHVYMSLDLSSIPSNVHALQWDNNVGWIEFNSEAEFRKMPNENITVLPDWASTALTKWDEAKAAQETQEAARLAATILNQPTTVGAQTL
jgi:hypothetical protein